MEGMRKIITDLHFDLLKCIMILMVKSSDGAANLARAKSVGSVFSKAAEDPDVLKAVCFQNVSVYNSSWSFQHTNGLLYKCARVGNAAAQYFLAKVILMSSSQLLARLMKRGCNNVLAANFMAHFSPDQACSVNSQGQALLHSELVRKFLCQCSAFDVTLMHLHLNDYVDYFTERGSRGNLVLHYLINKMCHYGYRVRASEEETMEDRKEMKEIFMEEMGNLIVSRGPRQSNQDVLPEGTIPLAELTEEDWYLRTNSAFVCKTYACITDFELNILDVFSEFEECRISALACFDHVFP